MNSVGHNGISHHSKQNEDSVNNNGSLFRCDNKQINIDRKWF